MNRNAVRADLQLVTTQDLKDEESEDLEAPHPTARRYPFQEIEGDKRTRITSRDRASRSQDGIQIWSLRIMRLTRAQRTLAKFSARLRRSISLFRQGVLSRAMSRARMGR